MEKQRKWKTERKRISVCILNELHKIRSPESYLSCFKVTCMLRLLICSIQRTSTEPASRWRRFFSLVGPEIHWQDRTNTLHVSRDKWNNVCTYCKLCIRGNKRLICLCQIEFCVIFICVLPSWTSFNMKKYWYLSRYLSRQASGCASIYTFEFKIWHFICSIFFFPSHFSHSFLSSDAIWIMINKGHIVLTVWGQDSKISTSWLKCNYELMTLMMTHGPLQQDGFSELKRLRANAQKERNGVLGARQLVQWHN